MGNRKVTAKFKVCWRTKIVALAICSAYALIWSPRVSAGGSSTTTTLTVSSHQVAARTAITLTATVTGATRGEVSFCNHAAAHCDGAGLLGTARVTISGKATLKMILGAGSYSIYAKYPNTGSAFGSSSAPQAVTVAGAGNILSSTVLATPSGSAGNYTLSAAVTAFGHAAPSGTVSFVNTTNGNAVVATAALDPATRTFSFLPSLASPLTGEPAVQFVATGDFNHDGKADLAVLNGGSSGTVAIYLGNGDGTFGPPTSYAVGDNPQAITVADVNQDGMLDLLVPNLYDYTVSILLGNGDGTFQPQATTDTDYYPIFIAVGDFNNDGIPDLATANWDGYDVGIHIGIGDGTFQPEVTYNADRAYGVVVGDFDQDGIQDIATSAGTNDYIDILLGFGDGTFQKEQQINLPVSASTYWMAGGDLRNDGKSDLVVADETNAEVYVLLSNGDGTFQPVVSYATAGSAEGVSLGDMNGDGILDIVVPDFGGNVVSILLGNGDGTFAARTDYNVGTNPSWAALADLNGDGALDLVTSDTTSLTTTILLQTQSQTATATGVAVYGTGNQLVRATYPGDAERAASQSSKVDLTGSPQTSTTTVLQADPNPAQSGQSVTLTATVSPHPTGSPLGTVTFYSGEASLGSAPANSSGVAALPAAALPSGDYHLTAVYSGNTSFARSTSAAVMETVSGSFSVSAPSAPVTMAQGGAVQVKVMVPPLGGAFNQLVTMSASGLPPGATANFNPPKVTPGASGAPTMLTIQLAKLAGGIREPSRNTAPGPLLAASLLIAGCLLSGVGRRRSLRASRQIAFFMILTCAGISTIACGGGFKSPDTTPPSSYVVTITGTSGALHSSTSITVVVQ